MSTAPQPSGRTCVYCGGSPVTGEHAWPQWIAKYIPPEKMEEKADHYRVHEDAEGRTVQRRGRRYPFTSEVNCVCESCNTGWMAELEHTAEHELHAMIEGKPQKLHEWRQSIAATWAFKTAMMLEHMDAPETRSIPEMVYRPFRVFLRPLVSISIWMMRYVGEEPHHFGHGQLDAQVVGPEGPVDAGEAHPHAGVLSVGQLAFWYVGHVVQGGAVYQARREVLPHVTRVWPVTPLAEWPPDPVDDDGLRRLMGSLMDEFEPEPPKA